MITYQLAWDNQGRPRAENVLFRELPAPSPEPEARGLLAASLFSTSFIGGVAALVGFGKIPWFIPVIYIAMSLLTFCVYAFDKSAAMNRRWRTSEQSLHLMSLAGGWPGALIAQRLFHHKSKKLDFQAAFWIVVVLHIVAAVGVAMDFVLLERLFDVSVSLRP